MKKYFNLTLALVMALSLTVPSAASPISLKTAYAQEQVQIYEIGYNPRSDVIATFNPETGELRISGKGPTRDFVTGAANPFSNRDGIKSVVVEEGITALGDNLFLKSSFESLCSNNKKLNHVVLPRSLTSMGN